MKEELIILWHVILASTLTGIVGFEREQGNKPAGVRTNMLVGGATALLVELGKVIILQYKESGLSQYVQADPTRVIQAIIVGISFIGAGIVLQIEEQQKIRYLNTAATILFSSGIGIAVALNQFILAIGITLLILFINYLLVLLTRLFRKKNK